MAAGRTAVARKAHHATCEARGSMAPRALSGSWTTSTKRGLCRVLTPRGVACARPTEIDRVMPAAPRARPRDDRQLFRRQLRGNLLGRETSECRGEPVHPGAQRVRAFRPHSRLRARRVDVAHEDDRLIDGL